MCKHSTRIFNVCYIFRGLDLESSQMAKVTFKITQGQW